MGVAQHGGISDPLDGQGLGENFRITGMLRFLNAALKPSPRAPTCELSALP